MEIHNVAKLRKKVRTVSGVTIVSVMTAPLPCPGKCIYCPGGDFKEQPSPKSYLPKSPTVLRASRFNYDAREQVEARVQALNAIGHISEKNEVIVMGGTFMATPNVYRYEFIKGIYNGLNGYVSKDLEEAKKFNETAKQRCVALCIETRPDWCHDFQIDEMLSFGTTRVEIGIQVPDDESYKLTKRGHTVQHVIETTRKLKDAGFKVFYHYMCNLPGSDFEKDIMLYEKLFSNSDFQPDGLKIYPCQVIENTEMAGWIEDGRHIPYTDDQLVDLIAKCKLLTPRYARIQSIMRAFPAEYIVGGSKYSHLRMAAQALLKKQGKQCKCIRCREVGYNIIAGKKINPENVKLNRMDYDASGGKEIFLSFDDSVTDSVIGILRLRIPSFSNLTNSLSSKSSSHDSHRPEITNTSTIVRELHVYGWQKGFGDEKALGETFQHRGYGRKLLEEAEKITKEIGFDKIVVISGIGARKYYEKFGYILEGAYMAKNI